MGLGLAAGALSVLALLGAVGLVVVYTGAYNVSATEEHASFTRWAFDTTFHNSVGRRADDVLPPEVATLAMLAAGPSAYRTMCQHGAPGVADRLLLAAGPVRVTVTPDPGEGTEGRDGLRRRAADMVFEVGESLRVGCRGYLGCGTRPTGPAGASSG